MADKDRITDALERWRIAQDAEKENRELALDDKKFAKLGGKYQWPDDVWEERKSERRPCLTINRLPQFLKQVINDQLMNKPAITVRPVDDQGDIQTARIFQGLIRNIEVSSGADTAYDNAFDDAVTMGFGFFKITTEYASDTTFEQDVKIRPIENAFTVDLDPTDWFSPQYGFISEMVKRSVFEKRYGFLPKPAPQGQIGTSMQGWYDGDLVRVAEYWEITTEKKTLVMLSTGVTVYKDKLTPRVLAALQQRGITVNRERDVECPVVTQELITGQELADEGTRWAGRYIPIVPVLGECIDIEGKKHRMGLVRHAKDPQRMFNFWRTASTELVALAPKAPWMVADGQIPDDDSGEGEKWSSANTKSHAYLTYTPVEGAPPPQRQMFSGVPAGALQESLNASDDMKATMGLYDASLGARSNETSGIAINARKREGDVSTFNYIDNLSKALEHAGRILIDLIPRIYDTARVVRIIGPDDKPETVAINRMFMSQDGQQGYYDLSTGKYDVVVKVGPSFTTQREEARDAIIELIRVFPQAAPVVGPLLVKNMDFPDAEEIATTLKAMLPSAAKGGPSQQEQKMLAAIKDLHGKLLALQSEKITEKRKLDIDAYGKETDRLKTVIAALPPELQIAIVQQTMAQVLGSPDVLPPAGPPGGMPPQMPPGPFGPPNMQQPPQGGFSFPGSPA